MDNNDDDIAYDDGERPQNAPSPDHQRHPSVMKAMRDDTIQFGNDLVSLVNLPKRDRKKRYETLLDHCPLWLLFILTITVSVLVAVFALIGVLAPTGVDLKESTHVVNAAIWSGTDNVTHTTQYISPIGQEMYFYLRLPFNSTLTGIWKNDFKIKAKIYGRNQGDDTWSLMTTDDVANKEIIRRLRCQVTGAISNEEEEGKTKKSTVSYCRDIIVYHMRWSPYRFYKAEVSFVKDNIDQLVNNGFFNGETNADGQYVIHTGSRTNNQDYMVFEIISRLIFSLISLSSFIFFTVVTCLNQDIRYWHTYQRWLLLLLGLLFFYHNPFFVIQVFVEISWLFSIFHIIMSSTFIFTFLLYLLVFVHSLFKKPKERKIFTFYLSKIVLVGLMWLLTIVMLSSSRWYNWDDPAQIGRNDNPIVQVLSYAMLILGVLYAVYFFYYLIRAVASHKTMSKKYSSRFKVVIGFSMFVLISLLGILVVRVGLRYSLAGLEFFLPNAAITLYFVLLSVFFLPSGHVDNTRGMRNVATSDKGNDPSHEQHQHELQDSGYAPGGMSDQGVVVDLGMDDNYGAPRTDRAMFEDERDHEFDEEEVL